MMHRKIFLLARLLPLFSLALYAATGPVTFLNAISNDTGAVDENVLAGAHSKYTVKADKFRLSLSEDGKIASIELSGPNSGPHLAAQTVVQGCQLYSNVTSEILKDGSIEFSRHLISAGGANKCRITERFSPGKEAIRWDIVIEGIGKEWTAPIESQFSFGGRDLRYWSAWADGRKSDAAQGWDDPLKPVRMNNRVFRYGGESHYDIDAISVPIITIIDPNQSTGFSIAQSPEDIILEMHVHIRENGSIVFSRRNNGISPDKPVKFTVYFMAHEPDWRSGFGWYVDEFSQYFDPPNPKVEDVAGCGSYSAFRGDVDAHKFLRMNYRFNWNAVFDWPYIGMYIPPLCDPVEEWVTNRGETTSIARMESYCRMMRDKGFHVLSYFNTFEFGKDVDKSGQLPPRQAQEDSDLWRCASDFVYSKLRDALLLADKDYDWGQKGTPYAGWEGGTLMDPATQSFSDYLTQQIQRHIEKIPSSSGICIDRLDFARLYNHYASDDYSIIGSHPVRSLLISWYQIMDKIGPMMHQADKVILCNPLYRRIDMLEHMDGIFDEYGEIPLSLNVCSFLAVRKPIVAWTNSIEDPSPDAYLQRHLYMGNYVTVPFPRNDHAINPKEARVDGYYDDYGLLFAALKGKQWVLKPGVIQTDSTKAIANIFKVPGGYVVPVVLGPDNESVKITLEGLEWPGDSGFFARVLYPGAADYVPVNYAESGERIIIDVPLKRGCGLVRLDHTVISPAGFSFFGNVAPLVQTKIKDSDIRFTLDGREPTANSRLWEKDINLAESAMLKIAAFDSNGKKTTETIAREFIRVAPMAPVIMPDQRLFSDAADITISLPVKLDDCVIRYTTDGMPPTETSTVYSDKIMLRDSATITACAFVQGRAGALAAARFDRKPSRPSKPDIYLSDLEPLKASVGWGTLQADRSVEGNPLSIEGERFIKGMGVHSPSILEYPVQEDYGRFVAVVGVDDEVRSQNAIGSVVFRVYALNRTDLPSQAIEAIAELPGTTLLYETPVITSGGTWHIDTEIPRGTKIIRLVVTAEGDNYHDHADWADAGFVKRRFNNERLTNRGN